jgi:hypothetical protein
VFDPMTNDTNDMYHTLEKKVTACKDFLSATLLLKAALETEEMTEVDHLIGRRQELIRIIDDMDRRIGQHRHAGLLDENRRIVMLSEDFKQILKQIASANRDCDAITAGRCEGLRRDLMNIHRKKEGIHGYGRSTEKAQKFLNIQT